MTKESVTQTLPSFSTVDEVPEDVTDCWIGEVLYHRCGAGRKNQRKNAVDACGKLKPHCTPQYHANALYAPNAMGHSVAITCAECITRHKGRAAGRPKYSAETPRDRRVVVFKERPQAETDVGMVQLGVEANGEQWFNVRPMLALTRFEDESGLRRAVDADTLLGPTAAYAPQLAEDGKRREMLHLPWAHWPEFIRLFGNEKTVAVQQAVHRVIVRAFGTTREEVGCNMHAEMYGQGPSLPPRAVPELTADTMLQPGVWQLVEQLRAEKLAAESRMAAARQRREAASYKRAEAAKIRSQAELVEREAEAEEAEAKRDEEAAQAALLKAGNDFDQAIAPTAPPAYLYLRVFGERPTRKMYVIPTVEIGQTTSPRKNDGNTTPAVESVRVLCASREEALACEKLLRRKLKVYAWGNNRMDYFRNVLGPTFWALYDFLKQVQLSNQLLTEAMLDRLELPGSMF